MSEHPHLTELIQSMSGSEKRYFKVNAAKNTSKANSRFIQLFDALDKGKKLSKTEEGKNPSLTAAYLHNAILESIEAHQLSGLAIRQLEKMVRHAAILSSRGLADQSMKLLLKVEGLAESRQEFIILQQVYRQMRTLLASNRGSENLNVCMDHVLNENRKSAKEIALLSEIRFIQYEFQQKVAESGDLKQDPTEELKDLLNSEVMKSISPNSGLYAQITAYNIRSQFYMLTGNDEQGMLNSKKMFDLCYEHKDMLQERGRLMIAAANNYMVRCNRVDAYNEIERVLDLLEKDRSKHLDVETIRLETYYSNKLTLLISTGNLGDNEILGNIESELSEYEGKMNQAFVMLILGLSSQYAFAQGDMKAALYWVNRFINHENRNALSKNLGIAYKYRLLIYYQQGKFDLIENMINSQAKKNTEIPVVFPLISALMDDFFLSEMEHGERQKENLQQLSKGLQHLKKNQLEEEAFEFFPFDEWVDRLIG